MAKPWTEAEDEYLIRYFSRHGHKVCAKKLPGRSEGGVQCRARRLGLKLGEINGYISISELAEESGIPHGTLWIAAKQADALFYPGKSQRKALVKIKWADQYVAQVLERQHNEREGGLTFKETMERLGVKHTALQQAVTYKRGYLAPFAAKLTVREGDRGRWLFNKDEVEWVRLELAEYRAKLKGLKTGKTYWLENEPDVPYSTALSRIKNRHRTVMAVKGGIYQLFVDEAA